MKSFISLEEGIDILNNLLINPFVFPCILLKYLISFFSNLYAINTYKQDKISLITLPNTSTAQPYSNFIDTAECNNNTITVICINFSASWVVIGMNISLTA